MISSLQKRDCGLIHKSPRGELEGKLISNTRIACWLSTKKPEYSCNHSASSSRSGKHANQKNSVKIQGLFITSNFFKPERHVSAKQTGLVTCFWTSISLSWKMPDCIQSKQFYDRSGEAVANSNAMPCLHTQAAVTPQLRGRLPKYYWEYFIYHRVQLSAVRKPYVVSPISAVSKDFFMPFFSSLLKAHGNGIPFS